MMRNNQDEWEVEILAESNHPSQSESGVEINNSIYQVKKPKKSKSDILVQRSEASLNISEFNVTEIGKEKIKLNELVKTSLKTTGQAIHTNLKKVTKLKKLHVPLNKKHQEKVRRGIAYEKVCEEVTKWDNLVHSNRNADQLVFPLKKPDFQLQSFKNTAENFVTKHPVEMAVSELLDKSENKLEPTKELTDAEEKALQAMSAAEAKLRHAELMKHRALISYQEAKARRQNKIKSKRYHRLLKKEKLKQAMKDFEELQKDDSAKALEKLAELDKLRILERVTLKHRNTGKWAKNQKIRAKYNPDSRSVLKDDLALSHQLREKVDISENIQESLSSYVKSNQSNEDVGLTEDTFASDPEDETAMLMSMDNEERKDDRYLAATQDMPIVAEKTKVNSSAAKNTIPIKTVDDMADFLCREQFLDSSLPEGFSFGDENLDEETEDAMPMCEAFGNEDLIAEFREEKQASDKASRVEGIDTFLPGWGTWGGPNIKPSKRKVRRFFIKAPTPQIKKNTLGNVIINEDKDKKASVHQVSSLPFPFTNIHQFESYIRQPVGHTWNPQSSFQNLTAPKVITKMGKIIEPINSDDVVLKNKAPPKKTMRKLKGGTLKAF